MNYPIHTYDNQSGDTICIGTGNGFPSGMYGPLVNALGPDFHFVCLPPRPWWDDKVPEKFPNWRILADDLMAGLDQHGLAPVIGMGHSMSGMAMVMAAAENPGLFRALVLVDPIILPPIAYWTHSLFQLVGYHVRARMIKGAENRRREWPSLDDAYARFRGASVFRRCSDEMMRLYTQGITRPKDDGAGVELIYPPQWEAAIYRRSTAFNIWPLVSRLTVPVCVIVGAESEAFLPAAARLMRRKRPDFPLVEIPDAGHLVPFEEPEAVAQAARQFLATVT